jgi:mutator family transposase
VSAGGEWRPTLPLWLSGAEARFLRPCVVPCTDSSSDLPLRFFNDAIAALRVCADDGERVPPDYTLQHRRARTAVANTPEGRTTEWKSQALRAYQRRTLAADALIASCYLAGTNTRRVRRALAALFGGTVGKDTVSRTWRKVKSDWDAWNARSLAGESIVRLILDGTVVRVRLDRKATSISLLVVLGVRADGQKVLLAIKSMGGESAEAWRTVLDDLIRRGLPRPEFLIVDSATVTMTGSGLRLRSSRTRPVDHGGNRRYCPDLRAEMVAKLSSYA